MTEGKDMLELGRETFSSRLFVGTGKFSSGEVLTQVVKSTGTEMVTVAMKRANPTGSSDSILDFIGNEQVSLLPNSSGVRDAQEAVFVAQLAREALGTSWLKLEIHPDPKYLMPDPIVTLLATEQLV